MADANPVGGLNTPRTTPDPSNSPRNPHDGRLSGYVVSVGLPLLFLAIGIIIPGLTSSEFRLSMMIVVFLNASLAVGLVVSLGYAGLINLSHASFYGIGAYVTAILVTEFGWPLVAAMPLAMLAGALGATVLGVASFRVRGDYFAIVSIAFSIALVQVMDNWVSVTKGREGYFGIPTTSVFGYEIDSTRKAYYACLALLTITWIIASRFIRTFEARAMLAVRYDEEAAKAMGISVRATKLRAMAISGGLAGLAGAFLVATYLFVKPSSFDFNASFNILLWVIIGGVASLPGAVAASGGLTILTEMFRPLHEYRTGIVGVVVLIAVFYRGGVLHEWWVAITQRRQINETVTVHEDEDNAVLQ